MRSISFPNHPFLILYHYGPPDNLARISTRAHGFQREVHGKFSLSDSGRLSDVYVGRRASTGNVVLLLPSASLLRPKL